MPILILLFILFIIIILRPVFRVAMMYRRYKKAMENGFSGTGDHFSGQYGEYSGTQRKQQGGKSRKKVFSKDEGEYVAFEEISVETTTDTGMAESKGGYTAETTEEQITDADWVEIK